MPRKAERAKRRWARLCVECPHPSEAARCPACKLRERLREQRARNIHVFANRAGVVTNRIVAITEEERREVRHANAVADRLKRPVVSLEDFVAAIAKAEPVLVVAWLDHAFATGETDIYKIVSRCTRTVNEFRSGWPDASPEAVRDAGVAAVYAATIARGDHDRSIEIVEGHSDRDA